MEIRKLERWKQIVKKKQSRDETRTALILKLFQVKLIRLSEVGAGVLGEKDFKTNHHLYVNPAEQSWGVNKWGRQQLKKRGFETFLLLFCELPFSTDGNTTGREQVSGDTGGRRNCHALLSSIDRQWQRCVTSRYSIFRGI